MSEAFTKKAEGPHAYGVVVVEFMDEFMKGVDDSFPLEFVVEDGEATLKSQDYNDGEFRTIVTLHQNIHDELKEALCLCFKEFKDKRISGTVKFDSRGMKLRYKVVGGGGK
jgi:hypothetical protein